MMSGRTPGETCTEFQMHKSQLSPGISKRCLFDYTEFRLTRYIEQITDKHQKATLTRILKEYKQGLVVVAWKSGRPIWFAVTKESTKG